MTLRIPAPLRRLLPLAVFAAALTVLLWQVPEVPVSDDAARDQLMARDCVEAGHCHLVGATTSLRGVHQGTAWIDALVAVRLLGGAPPQIRVAVLGALALAISLTFLLTWRWLRPAFALPAALLLLAAVLHNSATPQLINPSAVLLPEILCTGALLLFVHTGRRLLLPAAGLTLALAFDTHVAASLLLPAAVAVPLLAGQRPWRDLGLLLGALLVTHLALSPSAFAMNLRVFAEHGWLVPALLGLAGWSLAARAARNPFQHLPIPARTAVLGGLVVLPWALGVVWLVLVQHHPHSDTYDNSALAPLAVGVAALGVFALERLAKLRRLQRHPHAPPTVAVALACLPFLAAGEPQERYHTDTFAETEQLAAAVRKAGWTWPELPGHIGAMRCEGLLVGLSAALPDVATTRNHSRQLRILRDTTTVLPGFSRVAVGGGRSLQLGEIDAWLQDRDITVCRKLLAGGRDDCQPAGPYAAPPLLAARSYPMWFAQDHAPTTDSPHHVAWDVPWQAGADGERNVQLLDPMTFPGCAWRITQVSGATVDSALPARSVTLRASPGTRGVLRLEADSSRPGCPAAIDRGNPPCWFESRPDEASVRKALEEGQP